MKKIISISFLLIQIVLPHRLSAEETKGTVETLLVQLGQPAEVSAANISVGDIGRVLKEVDRKVLVFSFPKGEPCLFSAKVDVRKDRKSEVSFKTECVIPHSELEILHKSLSLPNEVRSKERDIWFLQYYGVNGYKLPDEALKEAVFPSTDYITRDIALGGSIKVPKDWHFRGGFTDSGFLYVASKEQYEDGVYKTGMKINGVLRVNKRQQITAEAYGESVVESLRKVATSVKEECPDAEPTGKNSPFTRRCLIVEQDISIGAENIPMRLIVSIFHSNDMDIAVVATFGAPIAEWNEAKTVYDNLGKLVLFDPVKLKKQIEEAREKKGE